MCGRKFERSERSRQHRNVGSKAYEWRHVTVGQCCFEAYDAEPDRQADCCDYIRLRADQASLWHANTLQATGSSNRHVSTTREHSSNGRAVFCAVRVDWVSVVASCCC
jgi:hypothetical protein